MPASGGEANEFDRLKTLLFKPESERLSAAEAQIHGLETWVGDARSLEAATAQILVEALRRAEVARHRELAAAVAPVIVAAIRSEIQNSRDLMVEALYPITGRLVSAAVANAFRELLDAINQRLEALVSTNQWRLRLKSWMTGRSVAEIALSEARGAWFRRILLCERGGGRVLAQWRPAGGGQDNPELISGMIAAISEFASSVLSAQHGELRTLDLGASQLYLRGSSRIILAGELVGALSRIEQQRLDVAFLELVERHDRGEPVGEADLAALARDALRPAPLSPAKSRLRWALVWLIAAALLAAALERPIYRWRKSAEIEAAYHQALAHDPTLAAYPLRLRENWTAGTVTLTGLAVSGDSVDRLAAALKPAAAPLSVAPQIEIVATARDVAAARAAAQHQAEALADLGRRLDADRLAAAARADALGADIAAGKVDSDARIAAANATLAAANAALAADVASAKSALDASQQRLDALQAQVATVGQTLSQPRRRLADALAGAVVYFGEDDAFVDPIAAGRTLDAVAAAIKQTGEGVRVAAYADETGSEWGNERISRMRGEKIARELIARGAPLDEVVAVGRADQNPITNVNTGGQMRNRRAVFEPLFPAERAP